MMVWAGNRRCVIFRRVNEAQVIVGSSLVLGSAVGPAIAGLVVDSLGCRGLFGPLAGIGAIAIAIVVWPVPETMKVPSGSSFAPEVSLG
jgi:predicted MFS family arabinose efflux permease